MLNKVLVSGINTSGIKVLTGQETLELLKRLRGGDVTARGKLFDGNLRLVLSVVQRFRARCENVDDLFQVGSIGLLKAIDNFDLSQNVMFSTYAVPMVIGETRRYLRDNNPVRVSRSLRDTAYRALQARDSLAGRLSREPSVAEIAADLGIDPEQVVYSLEAIQDPVSLFEPVFHDSADAASLIDQIPGDQNPDDRWALSISLREALSRLSKRERAILALRFFHGKTQMEVSSEVGISQAQVSRLEKAALVHMRKHVLDRDS